MVDKVIQTNGFYAHPENMILSMVTDEDVIVRRRGVSLILDARDALARLDPGRDEVRKFTVPEIKFSVAILLCLQKCMQEADGPPILDILPLPNHTQSVGRLVQQVSKAARKVVGREARDGLIRNAIKSRENFAHKKFSSKSAYLPA